ncbi:MAG: CPBP family intramembrane metalloprotease [Chloroflexi bacterium]|nr:CPBP family intramembrane metalloprotease [Chloroflexota bacterium]
MQAIRNYPRAVLRDCRAALQSFARNRAALVALIVLMLPWWALIFLRADFDWLSTFGGAAGIALTYWWLSRSGGLPAPTVKYPRAESLFAFALILIWIGWRIGICGKYFPFLPANFVCFKNLTFEIVPKVIEQVIVPIVVLFILGYRWCAQGLDLNWRAWWISSFALIGLLGYGAWTHWNDLPKFGESAVEYFFAAGLPEEVLFRALLLTRLEAWWRNGAWALLGSSIIFGLVHLPINFFVFTARDLNEAWLTALTFQMGMGAVFAFAYQRARNVWTLAVAHALVNAA